MRSRTALYITPEIAATGRPEREMIPTRLITAMCVLALAALALTTFAVATGRPTVGQPLPAATIAERTVILSGEGQSAQVFAPDGTLLLDLPTGGFLAAVRQGLDRERLKHRIAENPPVTLARHANGRLSLIDPATGWRMELAAFGDANAAAWNPLFALQED